MFKILSKYDTPSIVSKIASAKIDFVKRDPIIIKVDKEYLEKWISAFGMSCNLYIDKYRNDWIVGVTFRTKWTPIEFMTPENIDIFNKYVPNGSSLIVYSAMLDDGIREVKEQVYNLQSKEKADEMWMKYVEERQEAHEEEYRARKIF